MKFSLLAVITGLAAVVVAAPSGPVEERQNYANSLQNCARCRDVSDYFNGDKRAAANAVLNYEVDKRQNYGNALQNCARCKKDVNTDSEKREAEAEIELMERQQYGNSLQNCARCRDVIEYFQGDKRAAADAILSLE